MDGFQQQCVESSLEVGLVKVHSKRWWLGFQTGIYVRGDSNVNEGVHGIETLTDYGSVWLSGHTAACMVRGSEASVSRRPACCVHCNMGSSQEMGAARAYS